MPSKQKDFIATLDRCYTAAMPPNPYQSPEELQAKGEITAAAMAMTEGRLGLVEGCRLLCRLRSVIGDTDSPLFTPFVAFDSETDDYPIGEIRTRYSPEYLEELDQRIQDLIELDGAVILDACRDIADYLAR